MSHKTMVKVAVVMIVVFGLIVIVYPTLFGPNKSPIEQPAAKTPLGNSIAP